MCQGFKIQETEQTTEKKGTEQGGVQSVNKVGI